MQGDVENQQPFKSGGSKGLQQRDMGRSTITNNNQAPVHKRVANAAKPTRTPPKSNRIEIRTSPRMGTEHWVKREEGAEDEVEHGERDDSAGETWDPLVIPKILMKKSLRKIAKTRLISQPSSSGKLFISCFHPPHAPLLSICLSAICISSRHVLVLYMPIKHTSS